MASYISPLESFFYRNHRIRSLKVVLLPWRPDTVNANSHLLTLLACSQALGCGVGWCEISLLAPVVYTYKTGLNGQVRILSSSGNAVCLLYFLGGIMDYQWKACFATAGEIALLLNGAFQVDITLMCNKCVVTKFSSDYSQQGLQDLIPPVTFVPVILSLDYFVWSDVENNHCSMQWLT